MITPSFGLTAIERVLPRLALDFTTASLDSRITFTRTTNATNPATYIDSSGVIVAATNNQPRFDYDPVTLACKGLLLEQSRTNALLNSDTLLTQAVVVTAAARTLSFYGTGQVVLSGTASATVTGTGAYPTRTTYTFTPTAGALTLTVTGTVQYAQLEIGSTATSYIPTTTTALTRNTDVALMTGTNFSDWFNQTEGTFVVQYEDRPVYSSVFEASDSTASFDPRYFLANNSLTSILGFIRIAGSTQMSTTKTITAQDYLNVAFAYKTNNCAITAGGASPSTDTSVTLPSTVNQIAFGKSGATALDMLNGRMSKFFYYPQRLTNAELQAFSK